MTILDTDKQTSESGHTVDAPQAIAARDIWQVFHWSFFINVQALIICLKRFQQDFKSGDYQSAETELLAAADLLDASGAAMQLAGSFSAQEYDATVRVSMMQPAVASDNFSGLMSWEHSALMATWRKMRPIFNDLPSALDNAHEQFVRAYYDMALGHTKVCEKFGGADEGSLRFGERSGVDTLKRFGRNRSGLIDPKQKVKGCPFSV